MILVTGATGTVGGETVRQLAKTGARVRALVRNPAKAKAIDGPGVEIAAGDLADPASLSAALAGVEKAFLLPPLEQNTVALQENLIAAGKRAGIRQIVRLGAMGEALDSPVQFLRLHAEAQKKLEGSGVPFTELQPNGFMQNVLLLAPTIVADGVFYQPAENARISQIDVRDIAAVAVKALTEPGHERKTYVLTGPRALSFGEIAETLTSVLGKQVRYVNVPPAEYKKALVSYGTPDWAADAINALFAFYREGKGERVTNSVEAVTGRSPRTFEQFARDHAAVFQAR